MRAYNGPMRTNNDTWDITTSVGSTALFVAASRALEANKADPLVVDPYAEVFCRAVGGEWADLLDGKAPDHKLATGIRRSLREFSGCSHEVLRYVLLAAADAGVRQIVIPAAGLDSRAYRLDWPNGTVVFELDQPQVLDFKREVLAGRGDHRGRTAGDRGRPARRMATALRENGFDPANRRHGSRRVC